MTPLKKDTKMGHLICNNNVTTESVAEFAKMTDRADIDRIEKLLAELESRVYLRHTEQRIDPTGAMTVISQLHGRLFDLRDVLNAH